MNRRILIIGGIAAGPSAASKAKRTDPKAEVILFEQGDDISSGICEMPYYIGNVIDNARHLSIFTPQTLEKEKGVKVFIRHYVESIAPARKTIVVSDLGRGSVREERYDSLIITTGSRPRKIRLEGENARNAFHIKSLEGALALKKFLDKERPRKAVIIGGGYIGMEMAEALSANRIGTTILHRRELPLPTLESETRRAVANELEGHGVDFVPDADVQELIRDVSGAVSGVRTSSDTYPCDVLVIAAGVEPNSHLAAKAGIRVGERKGILTDQRQTTSEDSIYAAGDCCEVKNLVNNKWMYIPLATTASKQGRTAGENAAGGNSVFKGVIRAIAVKVFDLQVAHVGLSSSEARLTFDPVVEHIESDSIVSFFPGNERIHLIAIADRKSRRLLGANAFGRGGAVLRADVLAVAIQHGLTIDDLAQLDLIYTPPYSPLWDPLLTLGNQMRKKLR